MRTIRACREAVQRAYDAAPSRSSVDEHHKALLRSAADVLGHFETMTVDQIEWLKRPEAQAAVKAAFKAAKQ
jgi:hypothetical protein